MTKDTRGRWGGVAVVIVLLLTVAGCRQPDGPMPTPQGEQPGRIQDISRDLQNVAAEDPNGPDELLDDLGNLDPVPRPAALVEELSMALTAALAGTDLPAADAERIASLSFVAISARELSEAQIATVGTDLRDALVTAGADMPAAERAGAAASALAGEVTRNRKRWYHR